jgi:hypothetical protein
MNRPQIDFFYFVVKWFGTSGIVLLSRKILANGKWTTMANSGRPNGVALGDSSFSRRFRKKRRFCMVFWSLISSLTFLFASEPACYRVEWRNSLVRNSFIEGVRRRFISTRDNISLWLVILPISGHRFRKSDSSQRDPNVILIYWSVDLYFLWTADITYDWGLLCILGLSFVRQAFVATSPSDSFKKTQNLWATHGQWWDQYKYQPCKICWCIKWHFLLRYELVWLSEFCRRSFEFFAVDPAR